MIAAAAWVWALVGVVAFLAVGLLVMLALGAFGVPGDALRRLWHTLTFRRRLERGTPLPDEVPDTRREDR
ncbi:MAG TPA: hypothetical protein VD704_04985 [Gaiellaceae bacterium]|nr:hypothetical protein [Gaiellaceae bacterium]